MDVTGGGSTAGSGAGSVSSSGMLGSDMAMHVSAPKAKKRTTRKAKGHKLPPTKQDAKLSIKHHRDSVAFNLSHAKDHLDEAKQHVVGLKKVTKLEKQLSSLKKGKVKF